MMNNGKIMEQQWRKSAMKIPGLYYQRMKDGTATFNGGQAGMRFQASNPYDCFMFLEPTLYLLELKSHNGASLPYTAIRKNQLDSLATAAKKPGVEAGFVVHFREKDECWFVNGLDVKEFVEEQERKSIPIAWFRENGVKVEMIHLRHRVMYDVQGMMISLAERRIAERGNREERRENERLLCL